MRHSPVLVGTLMVAAVLVGPAADPSDKETTGRRDDGLASAPVYPEHIRRYLEAKAPKTIAERNALLMSTTGAMAAGLLPWPEAAVVSAATRRPPQIAGVLGGASGDIIVHGAGGDVATQSETTIAANPAGTVLVAGYNEFRGFTVSPVSLSGVARSTDGGTTWNEVPVGPGGLGVLPSVTGGSVFGDPDVKWSPSLNGGLGGFVYSSIYVRPSDGLQGMSVHVSSPDGSTWTGPLEVGPSFIAGAAADKEFIDANAVTGRILMTWTNFGATIDILRTYSDDGGTTWAPAVTIGPAPAGGSTQSSIPRFLPGADNPTSKAYAVWRTATAAGRNIGFSSSNDGGVTWTPAVTITTAYPFEDQILGVDRVNTSPSLAVDYDTGNIYVVYQRNSTLGTGDIAFQMSTDGGANFSSAVLLTSNPGADRPQFYPWVTVDQSNSRVHVMWYDQDTEATGDMLELMHTSSSNAGTSWAPPTPNYERPFHAGYGNDTGQPNLGDYIQAVAFGGAHHALASKSSVAPRYDEGQPTSASMFTPDSYYARRADTPAIVPLRLAGRTFTENCGTAQLAITLENYVANPLTGPATITGISATLSTTTPGVTVTTGTSAYANLAPLATGSNTTPFAVQLAGSFVSGTYIEFRLSVTSAQGTVQLPFRVPTGGPDIVTTLLSEDFQGVTPPALPTGWSSLHGGGTPTINWITDSTFTGSNAAFHANNVTIRFERLLSPVVAVPTAGGDQSYVTLDFDLKYNLEDDPTKLIQAFDGLTLRITDQTTGAFLRSVLAESFAEVLNTASDKHFPKHLPRLNSTAYLQDMSVWSGDSGGIVHVSMKFPGAGMTGRSIQLRFEYTEDTSDDCTTPRPGATCGVAVDNIVLRHVQPTGICAPPGLGYFAVPPCRVVDTRGADGPALAANSDRTFPVTGRCGIPSDAVAVAISLVAVNPTDFGNLRLYPAGGSVPLASAINFRPARTRANNALVPLGTAGGMGVRCDMAPGSTGSTHFLFDVMGYFK